MALHLHKFESTLRKDGLCQVWLIIGPVFLEDFFLILSIEFFLFSLYLPLEKGVVLHFNKLESTLPKDDLSQVWLIIGPVFLEKNLLKILSIEFFFAIISP